MCPECIRRRVGTIEEDTLECAEFDEIGSNEDGFITVENPVFDFDEPEIEKTPDKDVDTNGVLGYNSCFYLQ